MTLPSLSVYSAAGITFARYADVKAYLIASAIEKWGDSVSTDEEEFLGHVIEQVSLIVGELGEVSQSIYDGQGVVNSSGVQLANNLGLVGVEVEAASYATGTVDFTTSEDGVTIPAGTIVSTSGTGLTFATDDNVTITEAGTETLNVTCTVIGVNTVATGDIDTLVTNVSFVTTVSGSASGGSSRETDAAAKTRHSIIVANSGMTSVGRCYQALTEIDSVSRVLVFDNNTDAAVEGVDANSVFICVGSTGSVNEDIASAIAQNITASVDTFYFTGIGVGYVNYDYYDETTSQEKEISWQVADAVSLTVVVGITPQTGRAPDDWADQIETNISEHIAALQIGDDVIFNSFYRPIYDVPGITVDSLTINGGGVDITIEIYEYASEGTITVS